MHNKNPINYRENQVSGLKPMDNLKSYQTVLSFKAEIYKSNFEYY